MDCYCKLLLASIVLILTTYDIFITSDAVSMCNTNANFTPDSTFGNNLNIVVSSLSTNINSTGFYYNAFGLSPDKAFALVLCRADVSLDECKNCAESAASDMRTGCSNQKEVVNWFGLCMLRYSNETLYGKLAMGNRGYSWYTQNVTSPDQFRDNLGNLLDDLRDEAANGGDLRKMAAGNVSGPDGQTIYAMVQCTPDLSPEDCTSCLLGAGNDTLKGVTVGASIYLESCFILYQANTEFYNETRIQELTKPLYVPVAPVPDTAPEPSIPMTFSPPPPPADVAGNESNNKNRTGTIIIATVVSIVAFIILLATVGCIMFRKSTKHQQPVANIENSNEISTIESLQYDFGKIRAATNDFSDENKLGQGGFGAVYKGKLENGQEIAVKRLSANSGQGDLEFKNEVLLLAKLQHRNLVRLLGFSLEGTEKLLVYELVENASLDQFIFDPTKRSQLDWDRRRKIIGGIARGILYLHEDSRLRIIHRDLKASNVLLDSEMNPKIADFGMARLFAQDDQTHGSTSRIVGTFGYIAPEYAMHGKFSTKSDVFSFGVLLLEIISSQRNSYFLADGSVQDLLSFAWKNWRAGTAANMIDPILKSSSGSIGDIFRCIHVGLLCVQENVADRPPMASIVLMLSSSSMTLPVPSEPAFFFHGNNARDQYSDGVSDTSSSAKLSRSGHL